MAPIFSRFTLLLFIITLHHTVSFYDPSRYSSVRHKVIMLDADNFDQYVYNSSVIWWVQYYDTACGICMWYSDVWRQLAEDIYNWRSFVKIGALNIRNTKNHPHCRALNITRPTVRLFPIHLTNYTKSIDVPLTMNANGWFISYISRIIRIIWPSIGLIRKDNVEKIAADERTIEFLLIVEPSTEKPAGYTLFLDLSTRNLPWLTIKRGKEKDFPSNKSLQLFSVSKSGITVPIPLPEDHSRASLFHVIRDFYQLKGYVIPPIEALSLKRKENQQLDIRRRQKLPVRKRVRKTMVHTLYQTDLDSALISTLTTDIPLKAHIEGEAFNALLDYLAAIENYFPFASKRDKVFVERLTNRLRALNTSNIAGEEFERLVKEYGRHFLQKPLKWVGCAGSKSVYRGYPCGLWMLFHTLTVGRYAKETSSPATKVLSAICGYVEHFLICRECADHFIEMSKTIEGNVTRAPDDVLWLWKAHNKVNKMLMFNGTEDPAFQKQQFPHHDVCPQCRDKNYKWDESEVLWFLYSMYTLVKPRDKATDLMVEGERSEVILDWFQRSEVLDHTQDRLSIDPYTLYKQSVRET